MKWLDIHVDLMAKYDTNTTVFVTNGVCNTHSFIHFYLK